MKLVIEEDDNYCGLPAGVYELGCQQFDHRYRVELPSKRKLSEIEVYLSGIVRRVPGLVLDGGPITMKEDAPAEPSKPEACGACWTYRTVGLGRPCGQCG